MEVSYIDLRDFPMPLYDGDLEAEKGMPDQALRLRQLMEEHSGFLLACPEYNSSIPGVLKNALDWASRPYKDDPDLICFKAKIVNLISASPGRWGGMRSLVAVRSMLNSIGCIVLPSQFCLSAADKAFAADGSLVDPAMQKLLQANCEEFVRVLRKLG